MYLRFGARPRRAYLPQHAVPEFNREEFTSQALTHQEFSTSPASASTEPPPQAEPPTAPAVPQAVPPTVPLTISSAVVPATSAAPAPVAAARYIRRRPKSFSRFTPPNPKSIQKPAQPTLQESPPPPPRYSPINTHPTIAQRSLVSGRTRIPLAGAVQTPTVSAPRSIATFDQPPPIQHERQAFNSPPPVLLVGSAGAAGAGSGSGHGLNRTGPTGAAAITNRKRRAPDSRGCVSCGIRSRWHTSNKTLN